MLKWIFVGGVFGVVTVASEPGFFGRAEFGRSGHDVVRPSARRSRLVRSGQPFADPPRPRQNPQSPQNASHAHPQRMVLLLSSNPSTIYSYSFNTVHYIYTLLSSFFFFFLVFILLYYLTINYLLIFNDGLLATS